MDETNDFFRSIMLARETFHRLQREGHSAAAAKRLVLAVINSEEAEMARYRRPFDEAQLVKRLQLLPVVALSDGGGLR